MTVTPDALARDANGVPITENGILTGPKTITFVGATTGAVGATTLFTITGTVAVNVFGFCTTDLAGSGTIELGVSGATACLADQQSATTIDNHDVWHDSVIAIGGQVAGHTHIINQDIIQTIATNTVSGGVMSYYCWWTPISSDGNVVVA